MYIICLDYKYIMYIDIFLWVNEDCIFKIHKLRGQRSRKVVHCSFKEAIFGAKQKLPIKKWCENGNNTCISHEL